MSDESEKYGKQLSDLGKFEPKQWESEKTLEKLSSGYRINRSADDAAGLAISQRMRSLIRGLGAAEQNSADGVFLIQSGEGALDEIRAMLNRATELTAKSTNGVYEDLRNRSAMQTELDQMLEEIDRIAQETSFNSIHLFQQKGFAYELDPKWKEKAQIICQPSQPPQLYHRTVHTEPSAPRWQFHLRVRRWHRKSSLRPPAFPKYSFPPVRHPVVPLRSQEVCRIRIGTIVKVCRPSSSRAEKP